MKRVKTIRHTFVDQFPDKLEEGVLYVSIKFASAAHRCCCGCSREVVTPISPIDWALTFNGVSISLYPSIGNWNFPCRAHYWIKENRIEWAEQLSSKQIAMGQLQDRITQQTYFSRRVTEKTATISSSSDNVTKNNRRSLWYKVKAFFDR